MSRWCHGDVTVMVGWRGDGTVTKFWSCRHPFIRIFYPLSVFLYTLSVKCAMGDEVTIFSLNWKIWRSLMCNYWWLRNSDLVQKSSLRHLNRLLALLLRFPAQKRGFRRWWLGDGSVTTASPHRHLHHQIVTTITEVQKFRSSEVQKFRSSEVLKIKMFFATQNCFYF